MYKTGNQESQNNIKGQYMYRIGHQRRYVYRIGHQGEVREEKLAKNGHIHRKRQPKVTE